MARLLFGIAVLLSALLLWSRAESWDEVSLLSTLSFLIIGPLWGLAVYLSMCHSKRAALINGVLTFLVTATLLTGWHWAIFSSRTASGRMPCCNSLKTIAVALHAYHAKYGQFPPAYHADAQGKPIHSWRVLLLPFLDQEALYQQYSFAEPWDGPNNRQLQRVIVPQYHCPSSLAEPTTTSYVAVVGATTAWPGNRPLSIGNRPLSIGNRDNEIGDKLLLIEVADSKINWMEPKDLAYSAMDLHVNGSPANSISSRHSHGAHAATIDGKVEFVENGESPETIRQLLTIPPKP